ncbi:hypothetical protein [Saccharicrinis sp. FJH54]|uniref:hypothetical protein n=1 Tax=Saccharicrinis sp. FJH54 TaxID=3344665 RepID=UPI0035D48D63
MRGFLYILLFVLFYNCTNSNKETEIDLRNVPLKIEIPFIYDIFLKENLYPFENHVGHEKIYFGASKKNWHPLAHFNLFLDEKYANIDDFKYWYKNNIETRNLDQQEIYALIDRDVPASDLLKFFALVDSTNNDKIYIAVKVINDSYELVLSWVNAKKMIQTSDSIISIRSKNKDHYHVISFENWINYY